MFCQSISRCFSSRHRRCTLLILETLTWACSGVVVQVRCCWHAFIIVVLVRNWLFTVLVRMRLEFKRRKKIGPNATMLHKVSAFVEADDQWKFVAWCLRLSTFCRTISCSKPVLFAQLNDRSCASILRVRTLVVTPVSVSQTLFFQTSPIRTKGLRGLTKFYKVYRLCLVNVPHSD